MNVMNKRDLLKDIVLEKYSAIFRKSTINEIKIRMKAKNPDNER